MRVLKVIVTNDWGMMENDIEFFDLKEGKTLEEFVLEELSEDYDEEEINEMKEDEEKLVFESEEEVKMFFEEGMSSWYLLEK